MEVIRQRGGGRIWFEIRWALATLFLVFVLKLTEREASNGMLGRIRMLSEDLALRFENRPQG